MSVFKSLQFSNVRCMWQRTTWPFCKMSPKDRICFCTANIRGIFLQYKFFQTHFPNKIELENWAWKDPWRVCSLNKLRNPVDCKAIEMELKKPRSAEIRRQLTISPAAHSRSRSTSAHSNSNGPLNWTKYSVMACSKSYRNVSQHVSSLQ